MSSQKARFGLGVSDAIVVVVALLMLVLYLVDRQGFARKSAPRGDAAAEIDRWTEEVERGIRLGPRDAPVTILAFFDFECPHCERFFWLFDSLLTEHPNRVSVVIHHFPLPMHLHAGSAAVAAECADRQGSFHAFATALMEEREAMGVKPWETIAEDAGVLDLESFRACAGLAVDSFPRISHGQALAGELGIRGTPTVYVNGRRESWVDLRKSLGTH